MLPLQKPQVLPKETTGGSYADVFGRPTTFSFG
jgi:hypothetical protein